MLSLTHNAPHSEHTDILFRTDYGASELSDNAELSEDAYFVSTVKLPDEKGSNSRDVTYLGVADGVGSWREYGVDPRLFSHKLIEVTRTSNFNKTHLAKYLLVR
jgi:serine/threonine protein phosphatase PrpC